MRRRVLFVSILIGMVHFSSSAQRDSAAFQKKMVGDSFLFRKNVLPRFQDDTLFQSINAYVAKQKAIVYTITGHNYKKGLVVIFLMDSAGKSIKGISLSKGGEPEGMNHENSNLRRKILRRMNRLTYNSFEPGRFESWTVGATMPNEELVYKIEEGKVLSAIYLVDVPPGYFAYSKLETSLLYQFRDELWNYLDEIRNSYR